MRELGRPLVVMRRKVTLEVMWRETVCEEALQGQGLVVVGRGREGPACPCLELPLALAAGAAAAAASSAIQLFHWGSWLGCFETTAVPVGRQKAHIDI